MKGYILILALFFSSSIFAQQAGIYTEWLTTTSNMNWSSGMVTAEGFGVAPEGKRIEVGRLLACRAAVTDAQRNLIEATNGVRVTVSTSVSHHAAEYDIVKSAVEGVIKGARILSRDMGEDNTCKVTMGVFVSGQLSNSIYQNEVQTEHSVSLFINRFFNSIISTAYAEQNELTTSLPWSPDLQRLDQRVSKLEESVLLENSALTNARTEPQPTGLIIDVRGHRFLPSLAPNIQHPDGATIYPASKDKNSIVKSGKLLSLFSRSLEFALNHPIVGDNPLLIKGASQVDNATAIILNKQNGDRLLDLASHHFFAKPAVIIVLD
ncbi:hypothetical protein [Paraglaciecola sp. L3A3]|uniref:hypothetical protein n=1 Tax=Paraglaciecola sp. L3A3 TaxID=2686358 RepID=UPI00131DFA18|nr:hypothetical protein [Paraglaciecola sp. L3A3]